MQHSFLNNHIHGVWISKQLTDIQANYQDDNLSAVWTIEALNVVITHTTMVCTLHLNIQ